MKIVVTGGTGKAGRWAVEHLRGAGADVLNVDWKHDGSDFGLCLVTDLTDPGQAFDALAGADINNLLREAAEIVALRYRSGVITAWAEGSGFATTRCAVEPVEEMGMDAVYLEGVKQ